MVVWADQEVFKDGWYHLVSSHCAFDGISLNVHFSLKIMRRCAHDVFPLVRLEKLISLTSIPPEKSLRKIDLYSYAARKSEIAENL